MEKKAQLYEIIIKLSFAIFSFFSAIFVVKNAIFMFPLYRSFSYSETKLYSLIYNTPIGDILNDIGPVTHFSFDVIIKGFVAFLSNVEWIGILFLLMLIVLLLLRFMFINWTLIKQYLKLSLILIGLYILKFALFGILFAIFYKDGARTMALGFVVGTSAFLLVSIAQLFVLSLWIIKFIFNIVNDVKYYYSHWKIKN